MLNLNQSDAVHYTANQQSEIDNLISNRGNKTGKELWEDKGVNGVFDDIKQDIRIHCLKIQKVRCAYCETILEKGSAQIEHFAPKHLYQEFLYEPLNLVCSCPVCNGVAKKGKRDTIDRPVSSVYCNNHFKYVHPYLHDVSKEIKYKDPFRILIDREHSSVVGKNTIDMFHWDTLHARKKRLSNLLVWTTKRERRKMIAEILNYKGDI